MAQEPSDSTLSPDPEEDDQSSATDESDNPLLNQREARILGALMEKQMATPDAYPLTVNSLLNACNQKSSREPVTNLQQGEVVRSLRELESRKFVRYEMGARSERYEQTLTNELSLSRKQQALLCVMMLRGPQTVNELLTRTQRLYNFENRDDMEVSLTRMTQGDNPVAKLIGRSSGQRDDRFSHLLCGGEPASVGASHFDSAASTSDFSDQTQTTGAAANAGTATNNSSVDAKTIAALTEEVLELREQLEELYRLTGHQLPPN